MEKNEDLLNLNGNSKKEIKKPLIIGAAIFVVFVAGVILYGIISNKKEENVVVPPKQQNNQLFKELPIEDEKPVQTTDSIKNKLLEDENNQAQQTQQKETTTAAPVPAPAPQPASAPVEKKEESPQKTNPAPQPAQAVQKSEPIQKPQTAQIQQPKKSEPKKSVSRKYYIQVAALMRYSKPNPKFLKLIEKNGLAYKTVNVKIKKGNKEFEVKKVLVGPFTRKEAKDKLKIVKAKINQNAFIFRMK